MVSTLAETIRTGPTQLSLADNMFFRRRSLSNAPIYSDFLGALRENTTITSIIWRPRFSNNLTTEQRVEAYEIIGSMQQLEELDIAAPLTEASPVGLACRAPNLKRLVLNTTMSLRFDESAQQGLAASLKNHPSLTDFQCLLASHTEAPLDPILQALATCVKLIRVHVTTTHPVNGLALASLLAAPSRVRELHFATALPLELSWDFPRIESCCWSDLAESVSTNTHLLSLRLVSAAASESLTPHIMALGRAVQANHTLTHLTLESTTGMEDDACVALASCLVNHPSIHTVSVAGSDWRNSSFRLQSKRAFEAFGDLVALTGMHVVLGKPIDKEIASEHRFYYWELVVQMMLYRVGRLDVLKSQEQREWVKCLGRINNIQCDPDHTWAVNDEESEWELLKLECFMIMVKENPLVTKRIQERRRESMAMMIFERNSESTHADRRKSSC
ncbi:hypothetical protein MPSEU_001004300 [Mayamaea pseudoterrestris]|nr:hypothetical protein MPSEU_001004300 [Mayamaea pseudoterrestris]